METRDFIEMLSDPTVIELLKRQQSRENFLGMLSEDGFAIEMVKKTSAVCDDPAFFVEELRDLFRKLPVYGHLDRCGLGEIEDYVDSGLVEDFLKDYGEFDLTWVASVGGNRQHVGYLRKLEAVGYNRRFDEVSYDEECPYLWVCDLDDDIMQVARAAAKKKTLPAAVGF